MHLEPDARMRRRTFTQGLIEAATERFDRQAITCAEWQEQVSAALADAYLADDDPRWQSGFDGDERSWREARSLVLLAAPTSGTFLDVGCANGYLLQSLASWAPECAESGLLLAGPINDDAVSATLTAFHQAAMSGTKVVSQTDHRGKTRHVVWSERC